MKSEGDKEIQREKNNEYFFHATHVICDPGYKIIMNKYINKTYRYKIQQI